MNSPKDYLTDRVADTEKLLKGYFSFSGKSPVEVIFSGGVNDTIVVLPWSVFIKAIEAFLTETIEQSMEVGREEVITKIVKWMRIENEISIVHKDQWEVFIKSLSPKPYEYKGETDGDSF